jgi:hypothetical protein
MNKYFITFARHRDFYSPGGPVRLRRVTVTTPDARGAWALFEALYHPKHFTAYTFQLVK